MYKKVLLCKYIVINLYYFRYYYYCYSLIKLHGLYFLVDYNDDVFVLEFNECFYYA